MTSISWYLEHHGGYQFIFGNVWILVSLLYSLQLKNNYIMCGSLLFHLLFAVRDTRLCKGTVEFRMLWNEAIMQVWICELMDLCTCGLVACVDLWNWDCAIVEVEKL